MTVDPAEIFRKLDEAHQILDEPQFLVPEVCQITGATPKALEHFLDPKRGMVRLMGDWVNPGTGKRRRFTGQQVLMIAAAYAVNRIGFPQRWTILLSEQVTQRASGRITGLAINTEMVLLNYPGKNGDWAFKAVYKETVEEPRLPLAVLALDVDRLIDETLTQLMAIVNGEEIPDFSIPDFVPEPNWFGPNGGQGAWKKDEAGNWLLNGLTLDETREHMSLQGWRLIGDELKYDDAPRLHGEDLERAVFLANKHHSAALFD